MANSNLAEDPYETLANAIVLRAVQDYRAALKRLKKHPNKKDVENEVIKIEKFFKSQWYQALTSVDGEYLINRLRKEASM